MKDRNGREYAVLANLKEGDKIEFDDMFSCCNIEHKILPIQRDGAGLFVDCVHGNHYIDANLNLDGSLMGIYPA